MAQERKDRSFYSKYYRDIDVCLLYTSDAADE